MRLGFATKVMGREGIKDYDSRRWRSGPHLRVSLEYLRAIFDYLEEERISFYRVSSYVAPYVTHPDLPQFHHQLDECADELARLGERARGMGLRLTMHTTQYVILNSPVERVYESAVRELAYHARFLDMLGMGPEAVVITHGGGAFGDKLAAMARFAERYARLPEHARRRLVLENDEKSYSVPDVRRVHEATGIPLVLDNLHHYVNNPEGLSYREAAALCLPTWPEGVAPKIHYSTPRAEQRVITRRDRETGERVVTEAPALAFQHAPWVDPDEFAAFRDETAGIREYDVMVEAKQRDLAMLKLRADLRERGIETA